MNSVFVIKRKKRNGGESNSQGLPSSGFKPGAVANLLAIPLSIQVVAYDFQCVHFQFVIAKMRELDSNQHCDVQSVESYH